MSKNEIKMVIMDVDGTLTDGKIYMGKDGEVFKAFNAKDGLRIRQLPKFGIIPVIITGRESPILNRRAEELGISELHQGISNKLKILYKLLEKYEIDFKNIAYIGDDENDYTTMSLCGIKGCPKDAVDPIKNIADFISNYNGGNGAVREFLDYILEDKLKEDDLNCEYK